MIKFVIIKKIEEDIVLCDIIIGDEKRTTKFVRRFSWDNTFESDRRVLVIIPENNDHYTNKVRTARLYIILKGKRYYLAVTYFVRGKEAIPLCWENSFMADQLKGDKAIDLIIPHPLYRLKAINFSY